MKTRDQTPLSKPEFEELEAIMAGDADGQRHRYFFGVMAYRAGKSAAIAEAVRDFVRDEKQKPDHQNVLGSVLPASEPCASV